MGITKGEKPEEIGQSQTFVLGHGFKKVEEYDALIGNEGDLRFLVELEADVDRPEVRPLDAYHHLLSTMNPGSRVRLLQALWPDAVPRLRFLEQVSDWKHTPHDGLDTLAQALELYIRESPIPYLRRTILEFSLPQHEEAIGWLQGLLGALQNYGIQARVLRQEEIIELTHWVLNPRLE